MVMTSLTMCEILISKLPSIFDYHFKREGGNRLVSILFCIVHSFLTYARVFPPVVYEIERLAEDKMPPPAKSSDKSVPPPPPPPPPTDPTLLAQHETEMVIRERAKKMKEIYFNNMQGNTTEELKRMQHYTALLRKSIARQSPLSGSTPTPFLSPCLSSSHISLLPPPKKTRAFSSTFASFFRKSRRLSFCEVDSLKIFSST
jgi:hypothetical protein